MFCLIFFPLHRCHFPPQTSPSQHLHFASHIKWFVSTPLRYSSLAARPRALRLCISPTPDDRYTAQLFTPQSTLTPFPLPPSLQEKAFNVSGLLHLYLAQRPVVGGMAAHKKSKKSKKTDKKNLGNGDLRLTLDPLLPSPSEPSVYLPYTPYLCVPSFKHGPDLVCHRVESDGAFC